MSERGYRANRQPSGARNSLPQRVRTSSCAITPSGTGCRTGLSLVEYAMPHCYMMLRSLMADYRGWDGVIFFSAFSCPKRLPRGTISTSACLRPGPRCMRRSRTGRLTSPHDVPALEATLPRRAGAAHGTVRRTLRKRRPPAGERKRDRRRAARAGLRTRRRVRRGRPRRERAVPNPPRMRHRPTYARPALRYRRRRPARRSTHARAIRIRSPCVRSSTVSAMSEASSVTAPSRSKPAAIRLPARRHRARRARRDRRSSHHRFGQRTPQRRHRRRRACGPP